MFEEIIFSNLLYNEEYSRKVIPYLNKEYFSEEKDKLLFGLIDEYVQKYKCFPTKESLSIDLSNIEEINEDLFKTTLNSISTLPQPEEKNLNWLVEKTEEFCQDNALRIALTKAIKIMNNKKDSIISKGSIPQILSDALAVSFDSHIGLDFLEDSSKIYDFYNEKEERIEFDLDYFNTITKGGFPRKTLNIIMAGTGVGKSLVMCHMAANNLLMGKNVLYITLEMAEERIAERIYSNILDTPINEMGLLSKDTYLRKIDKVKRNTTGKLIIKEYPTASANSGNFRYLLNELRIKKNFVPDIIYIDYLNICASSRIKSNGITSMYSLVKAIAEEIRGLAIEFNVPIVSATQTNRTGFNSSDPDLTDTSESFGLPQTADFMIVAITNEELESMNQIMFKQLKNRYDTIIKNRKFVTGIDRSRMRLYNISESDQDSVNDEPIMNQTTFGERDKISKKFDNFF